MARERRGHTLEATALVHEAFIRSVDARDISWQDRSHFFGIAARLMRRVLVDHARQRGMQKRGGAEARVTLSDAVAVVKAPDLDLLALDRALDALERVDARKCRVVDMRFFSGMSVEETATALGVSPDTVKRDWRLAKLWLQRELARSGPTPGDTPPEAQPPGG
jgi:RNA polymerase sigma factor (TIGR02999 family)